MRPFHALLLLALTAAAAAADPIAPLRFADGKERSLASFGGEPVVLVYFCGHCPSASEFLGSEAKAIHAWLEEEHLRARLVLVTPDTDPVTLATLDQDRGYGMTQALYAFDPANTQNVSTKNILQCRLLRADGTLEMLPFRGAGAALKPLLAPDRLPAYRYARDGVEDAQVLALWWAVERGRPQAVKQLVAATKGKKSAAKDQAAALLERVAATLAKRQDELVAAPATLETVEALEAFMTEAEGTDTKPALARYKALKADKALKDELKARDLWLQCRQMLASPKPDQQKAGKEGLAMLARKLPDTMYGKKAVAAAP